MSAILIALVSGVLGTALGGVLCAVLRRVTDALMSRLMHFTAGLMLAIVCFELLPEAMTYSVPWGVGGLAAGMAVMLLAESMQAQNGMSSSLRTGVLVGVGIALHNLPEGLAVGAGYADAPALGMALCAAITLHDVPEGLAMALPLRAGGVRPLRVVMLTLLAGLPTMLGAGIGLYVGGISHEALAFCLALAGGAMLQVTCGSVLPEAQAKSSGRLESLLMALGVIIGGAVCYFL
jgi:ZIP family zinc transporter